MKISLYYRWNGCNVRNSTPRPHQSCHVNSIPASNGFSVAASHSQEHRPSSWHRCCVSAGAVSVRPSGTWPSSAHCASRWCRRRSRDQLSRVPTSTAQRSFAFVMSMNSLFIICTAQRKPVFEKRNLKNLSFQTMWACHFGAVSSYTTEYSTRSKLTSRKLILDCVPKTLTILFF